MKIAKFPKTSNPQSINITIRTSVFAWCWQAEGGGQLLAAGGDSFEERLNQEWAERYVLLKVQAWILTAGIHDLNAVNVAYIQEAWEAAA